MKKLYKIKSERDDLAIRLAEIKKLADHPFIKDVGIWSNEAYYRQRDRADKAEAELSKLKRRTKHAPRNR